MTLVPTKRASLDVGRKIRFWDDSAGTVAAVVKNHSGDVLTQPVKVPADGHLDVRFDQWPVYYSDNRAWSRINRVPGTTPAMEGLSAAEMGYIDGVTAGRHGGRQPAIRRRVCGEHRPGELGEPLGLGEQGASPTAQRRGQHRHGGRRLEGRHDQCIIVERFVEVDREEHRSLLVEHGCVAAQEVVPHGDGDGNVFAG
jgi:hypothetical protein